MTDSLTVFDTPDQEAAARPRPAPQMTVRYAIVAETSGYVLVAATDRGVCAILFGESDAALRDDLRDRFPEAMLHPMETASDDLLAAAYRVVAMQQQAGSLPLDLHGSDFQRDVWAALRDIPAGTTATYKDVARRIGRPRAVRAVASACAANPVAVAVPCHRVVGSDGRLGGYRWGPARKRALLRREGVQCST